MHRQSSTRKELRAERISQSPYKRSGRKQVTKQPSWLSNIANSISSSISKFRAGGRDPDDMSVSGSDDDWTGEPPDQMRGQDMFSLAAAAGRGGEEFEERAESWRANKGLLTSARRGSPSKANWDLLNLSPERAIRPSPSMPALQHITPLPTSSQTRQLFQTPRAQDPAARLLANSASARALSAFVNSKGDDVYSPQDVEAMESLIRSMRTDAAELDRKKGGWSGALATPMRLTSGSAATPAPATPGSLFSLGSTPAAANRSSSHHRVKYLGPGMSPRRVKTNTRSMSSLFDEPTDPGKRRKTGVPDVEVEESRDGPTASSSRSPLTSSASVPNLAAASKAADFNRQARLSVAQGAVRRPSPLAQSSVASESSPPTPRDIGKKRARDIIQDIIDEDITPHEEQPKLVINPYEETALPSGKHFSPYASLRHSSSSNSLSGRRSLAASRGAAAKLEESRLRDSTSGRKLSTLEMINRGRPSSATASPQKPKSKALPPKAKAPEPEAIEIDDDEEPAPPKKTAPSASAPTPSKRTPAPVTFPDTEPAPAFPAPSLSKSTLGASRSTSPSKAASARAPSTADAVVAASKPQPAPVFTPSPIGLGPPPAAPSATEQSQSPRPPTKKVDASLIYLSAKDSALSEDKAALPFFTFTLPVPTSQPSDAVKAAALKEPAPSFDFEVPMPPLHISAIAPPAKAATSTESTTTKTTPATFAFQKQTPPAGAWTCNTCMLQNPATATDKCSICEAPKPGAAAVSAIPAAALPSAPSGGAFSFKPPAKAEGEWTCDTCMLQNPASATEKCTVCEAPKPGAKPKAAPAAPAAMPSAPSGGGFAFGGASGGFKAPAKAAGEWTCDTCMLQNPASATEKCTVCEAPKPGAKPAKGAPAAMPSAPSGGGFSFGGTSSFKPPAKTEGEWTCDTCMLQNPASATEKCTICEAPKPGAKPAAKSAPSAPLAMPAPPTGGFSFGGSSAFGAGASSSTPAAPPAGMPAPPSGGFSFGGKAATGASSSAPASGGFSFKPPAGGFSFGGATNGSAPPTGGFSFGADKSGDRDKPAMLAKPTGDAGEWTCSTCMLKNPASATTKCTVCETPKP